MKSVNNIFDILDHLHIYVKADDGMLIIHYYDNACFYYRLEDILLSKNGLQYNIFLDGFDKIRRSNYIRKVT